MMAPQLNTVLFLKNGSSLWSPPPLGWPRICACLTWFDDATGAIEPWAFFEDLWINLVMGITFPLSPVAFFLKRTRARFLSNYHESVIAIEPLPLALNRWRINPEASFPDRIELRSNERPICIVESEFWNQAGGPAPYHDSVTLSFYSTEVSPVLILAAARAAARKCEASFEERNAI